MQSHPVLENKSLALSNSHDHYYTTMSTILFRYHAEISPIKHHETVRDIQHNLSKYGINFEGKTLPVSLHPTVLTEGDLKNAAASGQIIRKILIRVIEQFIRAHKSGELDSPFHAFFTPYYKWWDLIAQEIRTLPSIQLMRYDAIRESNNIWRFMENNTACPGGVIHCSRIRDAWLMTRFGRTMIKDLKIREYPIDNPSGFVLFLMKQAQLIAKSTQSNIAICNFKNTYTNELESLRCQHAHLVQTGQIPESELIIADIREVTCENNQAFIQGKPVSLIYNKLDPLMIDPSDPEIAGWIAASRSEKTDFLNSLGAMYLTESKRVCAMLSDPKYSELLDLSDEERSAIDSVIPYTRLLPSQPCRNKDDAMLYQLLMNHRHQFVVKADALTRGQGVFIGAETSFGQWKTTIESIKRYHGICQSTCNTPLRTSMIPALASDQSSEECVPVDEQYGIDLFYFDDQFSGAVSRCHTNKVFNVGAGGKESPTVVFQGSAQLYEF